MNRILCGRNPISLILFFLVILSTSLSEYDCEAEKERQMAEGVPKNNIRDIRVIRGQKSSLPLCSLCPLCG